MNYLSVENLSKAFGERKLFSNISFGISQGQKIALVGINGAGKSTLMKIIMGQEIADTGQVGINNSVKIAYVHQNPVKHGHVRDAMEWPYSSIHRTGRQEEAPC